MKNVLIVVLIAVLCVCAFAGWMIETVATGILYATGAEYAKAAIVTSVDRAADAVTFEDCNGNLWEWEGVEDWAVGDGAALLMNNHGTKNIYDDEIISAKYENWA